MARHSLTATDRDAQAVRELTAELATVRLGGPSVFGPLLARVRELLELESMLLYCPAEQAEGWGFEFLHHEGIPRADEFLARATRYLARTPHRYSFFDPARPEPAQRNRVIEGVAWVERARPGAWQASAMCREVFVPAGLEHHRQLRVLICDGPALLGWFGAIHDGPIAPRQARVFARLVPAMRRRLELERRLGRAALDRAALAAALEQLGDPAFVVGRGGTILGANACGRARIDRDRARVAARLRDAIAGACDPDLAATPIGEPGAPGAWLVVLRTTSRDAQLEQCVTACARRWGLTGRRVEVLRLVACGLPNATIAATLAICQRTVELHVTRLFDRAGVDSRAALVARVLTA